MVSKTKSSVPAKIERRTVGWREWVALPDLGVSFIKAKLDTGAKTSTLHAFEIETFRKKGNLWVRFIIHPTQRDNTLTLPCEALVSDQRAVTNSGGHREERFMISTTLTVSGESWPIELSLANRDQMGFRMLLGRSAMHRRLIVDPARSFQANKIPRKARPTSTASKTVTRNDTAASIPLQDDEEE